MTIWTGWEKHSSDAKTYNAGCPGIGMEGARWIAEDVQARVTGCDKFPSDAFPNPDPACALCVHGYLQTRCGIVNQENMVVSKLAADQVFTFTYMYSPVPITGATGSMGAPLAIH